MEIARKDVYFVKMVENGRGVSKSNLHKLKVYFTKILKKI